MSPHVIDQPLIRSAQEFADRLPTPVGALSSLVCHAARSDDVPDSAVLGFGERLLAVSDPWADDDVQRALAICYELSFQGYADAAPDAEWSPALLQLRRLLETSLVAALEAMVTVPALDGAPVHVQLRAMVAADPPSPLSRFLAREASLEQFREFVRQRSVYHLKEADPHTFVVPRISGAAKAALLEIQIDEYGGGRLDRMHSQLFAGLMRDLELDDTYGAYSETALPETLAVTNLMTMFALHRRWRGAAMGQLAVFEMTSTDPNRRYSRGLHRLGLGHASGFYDEHVEADAVHEQLAAVDLCGSLVAEDPSCAGQVLFGAAAALEIEARFGRAMLARLTARGA